jgi:hypothetical protein
MSDSIPTCNNCGGVYLCDCGQPHGLSLEDRAILQELIKALSDLRKALHPPPHLPLARPGKLHGR